MICLMQAHAGAAHCSPWASAVCPGSGRRLELGCLVCVAHGACDQVLQATVQFARALWTLHWPRAGAARMSASRRQKLVSFLVPCSCPSCSSTGDDRRCLQLLAAILDCRQCSAPLHASSKLQRLQANTQPKGSKCSSSGTFKQQLQRPGMHRSVQSGRRCTFQVPLCLSLFLLRCHWQPSRYQHHHRRRSFLPSEQHPVFRLARHRFWRCQMGALRSCTLCKCCQELSGLPRKQGLYRLIWHPMYCQHRRGPCGRAP
jgi:hypothetical protein